MSMPSVPEEKDKRRNIGPHQSFYVRPNGVSLDEKQWRYIQRRYRMSPRELQVAKLVCQGFTNGDMAEKLKVKPGTVKTHLRSIFGKTRVRNKITMLLRFMDDVNEFFGKSAGSASIPVTHVEKPIPMAPTSGEIVTKR